jgi:uncharacterized protein
MNAFALSIWVPYTEGKCSSCRASCCQLPVEVSLGDLRRLGFVTEGELSAKRVGRRLMREGVVQSMNASKGFFLLGKRADGSCRFQGEDGSCTVYERRPGACREFPVSAGPRLGYCPYEIDCAAKGMD